MKSIFNLSKGYKRALTALRAGGLVAIPTETVYGLAADASNAEAVAKIYEAKGRPNFNPLICHVSGMEMAQRVGMFDPVSRRVAEKFWPGPLTLIVPLKENTLIANAVTAGLGTIALRQPEGVMATLAGDLGKPIAAPSANTSGKISPTLAAHVADDLGHSVDIILDNGACTVGVESTILKVNDGVITLLREGGIAVEVIEAEFGKIKYNTSEVSKNSKSIIESPGQLLAHYAPSIPVRLNVKSVDKDEALLLFGILSASGHPHTMQNLSIKGELDEAARNLFAMLKELDKSGARAIAVQPIPRHGLGAAINDRLERAAEGAKLI
ncbi:MAG: L-threonylcarbamoyladenylate synthase [Rhizobiaceae bacterium]